MFPSKRNRTFAAEWDCQDGILIAWPHAGTDWAYMLDVVTACYVEMARAILNDNERLVIVAPDSDDVRDALGPDVDWQRIDIVELPTNDTWVRDYGPITVSRGGQVELADFTFNAWGMKFAADCDNLVSSRLAERGIFKKPLTNNRDLVLEGGSIETDGNGTVMTTTCCLTAPNRNDALTREQLEEELLRRLGCLKVLWLDHGELTGDDTDGHIDTLARFAPGGVILYTGCDDPEDEHFEQLMKMEQQLKQFTDVDGNHYHLVKLPLPEPIYEHGYFRLPATYANFLVTNHQVLVPVYGQAENDLKACQLIGDAFPGRKVVAIDCRPLIQEHGSLHCATMQLPKGALSLTNTNYNNP
ncbi:MAG: agmatine deiminase family protein [Muribaculaceae bacterium]|nr:agmatine deiminase family protein [Muribaculaceae bacterium]